LKKKKVQFTRVDAPLDSLSPYLPFDALPGDIFYQKNSNRILVKCCDGWWLPIVELKVEGKKGLCAKDFHNGYFGKQFGIIGKFSHSSSEQQKSFW
jgi:hypothetical protein